MNRWLNQFQLTFEKKVVDVYGKITFGATGAPTLSQVNSKGIVSVTRVSAGKYTFVFGTKAGMLDTYVKLIDVNAVYDTTGTSAAPAAPGLYVSNNSISIVNTASLTLVCTNNSGVATDPASGEIGYFNFTLGDSTAQ